MDAACQVAITPMLRRGDTVGKTAPRLLVPTEQTFRCEFSMRSIELNDRRSVKTKFNATESGLTISSILRTLKTSSGPERPNAPRPSRLGLNATDNSGSNVSASIWMHASQLQSRRRI